MLTRCWASEKEAGPGIWRLRLREWCSLRRVPRCLSTFIKHAILRQGALLSSSRARASCVESFWAAVIILREE